MPKELTAAEQAIVAKASQDLYRYEKTCEEHSAVLRREWSTTSKAYQEYTANSNPMGFMPPRNEFDHYIEESEKVLEKECRTVLDHLHVANTACFLCRLLMRKVSEHGEHVYLEFIRRKVELDKQYPYGFPESPSSAIQVSALSDYPAIIAARAFKSKEVMNLPRVLLQETEIIQYQSHPELLQRDTFMSFNEDEAEYEAFRVSAFITTDQERIFYVVYADEGPEAMACTSINLFDLLRTSERVLTIIKICVSLKEWTTSDPYALLTHRPRSNKEAEYKQPQHRRTIVNCGPVEMVGEVGLGTLPYDLLLNIAFYLDLYDIHALHLTCRSLYDASTTRPVYRKLANDLLRKCRALPLKGFQRLGDLNIDQLIRAVNKATHYDRAWRRRSPRPITPGSYINGINSYSNYMDVSSRGKLAEKLKQDGSKWYKVLTAPFGEEVDWLSPITSSYTLCATKSGKVVCWDVQSDTCLAEWNPGARWELWKCRVEFEERTVFFTMAKVLAGSYDDDRIMEFVLMRLTFSDGPSGESSPYLPIFSHVTEFRTTGVVMNVFLLDPSARLLSAFIWVSTSNTIGLYALPDWDKKEYVFIDTGIECVMSSNWSCLLFQQHIVIHCEESDAAFQHFYPLSLLLQYSTPLTSALSTPVISRRLTPFRTLTKKFRFPPLPDMDSDSEPDPDVHTLHDDGDDDIINSSIPILNLNGAGPSNQAATPSPSSSASPSAISTASSSSSIPSTSSASSSGIGAPPLPPTIPLTNINPHPFPPWYPESAHFVRQWWPSLPNVPRVSCTVVLLAAHDQETHRNRFVLAQHYFRVPLDHAEWDNPSWETCTDSSSSGKMKMSFAKMNGGHRKNTINGHLNHLEDIQDDALMQLWYVSKPFEVVRVFDTPGMDEEDDVSERPRPLVAVDFGHAVWIEYIEVSFGDDEQQRQPDQELELEQSEAEIVVENGEDTKTESEIEAEVEAEPPKRLRFVTFPPFSVDYEPELERPLGRIGSAYSYEGNVRTLETPSELDLGAVETINIDQSQGAIILSDKGGRIFILCYE